MSAIEVAAFWCVWTSHSFGAEVPRLEVVRAAYVESATSIRTIQCDLEIRWERLRPIPPEIMPPGLDPTVLWRVRLVQDGVRVARQTQAVSESGAFDVESWAAFDGSVYSRWRRSTKAPPGSEQLPHGGIQTNRPDELANLSVAALLGTFVFPDESVERLLRREGTRVVGWEDYKGTRCVKVELPPYAAFRTNPDRRLQVIAWFDPAHGYLPRGLRTIDPQAPKTGGEAAVKSEISVSDFQKISTDEKESLWVPVAGVKRHGSGHVQHRIRAANVVVNRPIPDGAFRPEFPFGTLIREQRPGQPEKKYYAGGDEGAKHYAGLSKASAAARPNPNAPVPLDAGVVNESANVGTTPGSILVLRWIGVICIALAIGVILKRKIR